MKYKITQLKPFINNKEVQAIKTPIRNNFITEGPQSTKFLQKLLKITGSKYGVLAPNGTLAIAASIMSLGLKKGDEIIIPNFTFYGSYSAAILAGLKPILCDVDRKNFQIDVDSAEKSFERILNDLHGYKKERETSMQMYMEDKATPVSKKEWHRRYKQGIGQ